MPKQTATTTIRLDPKLIETLKLKAKDDGRSLNNIINRVLSNFVKQADESKAS